MVVPVEGAEERTEKFQCNFSRVPGRDVLAWCAVSSGACRTLLQHPPHLGAILTHPGLVLVYWFLKLEELFRCQYVIVIIPFSHIKTLFRPHLFLFYAIGF